MTAKRITKKLTKIAAFILGGLVVLLLGFHLWFINHAEELIEDLVRDKSNGKVALKVKKFKFNWFNRKMELQQAVFTSTDTTEETAYRFKVDHLKIQVKQILPVIFEKKFYIDSIQLINPDISVTKLRNRDTTAIADSSLSIPQEMGRIYHSIQDALAVLNVDRFQIDNGTFSLIDKTQPDEKPIVISRLYFHLDNLRVDTTEEGGEKKILFSDDVLLHTSNQDILFPDGRHRLSFSNFRINIRNRLAEFDSCTIIATKGDSANNSFRIFFDKLRMTNIDFDTLYHTEVIKADSVYCINPRFRLDVDLPKRTGPIQPPKLDELIQQLTGNLQLAFVVVQNASFDINTVREGRPSSFTSDNNNFELQGLRIQEKAARPLTVERFAMAIRNYENFLRDSTYGIEFDSILLNNNRISLANFTYKEFKNNKTINSLSMPQFELQGLSWDDLIFDQKLNADRVTLYRPVISYNVASNKSKSQDIFNVLAGIGDILQLKNLDISHGQVTLFLSNSSVLQLDDATMSVSGKQLVDSRKLISIQRSVKDLEFKKATFKTKDWTAGLDNVKFNGTKNTLSAGKMYLHSKDNMALNANNVTINSLLLSENNTTPSYVKGIYWQNADLQLSSVTPAASSSRSAGFVLEDIRGENTKVVAGRDSRTISVQLRSIVAERIETVAKAPMRITGLVASGNNLVITDKNLKATVQKLDIADRRPSQLQNITWNSKDLGDSMSINVPSITLVPDINAIMQGNVRADAIKVNQPVIKINVTAKTPVAENKKSGMQNLLLGSLFVQQPVIHYTKSNDKGTTTLEWRGQEKGNDFEFTNLRMDSTQTSVAADRLRFSMDHFLFENAKGKKFEAGNGKLVGQFDQLAFQKNETESWDWQGTITSLGAENFVIDSLGKKGGTLTITSAKLNDLTISSALLLDMRELVSRNTRFNLQHVTGTYEDARDHFNWYDMAYDKRSQLFSLDSFSYRPVLSREEFLKTATYQSDYMIARTGDIHIGPFDIQRYIRDTILDLGTIRINDGYITSFRDKRIPRQPNLVKSLPVTLLKNFSTHLIADSLYVSNILVDYAEKNEKTGAEGKIRVSRLNGSVTNLRNFNLAPGDSLQIRASGYLQDTLLTKLMVRESYTDTLGGFLMTAQMGPADLRVLNPALVSLGSAELKSGLLDTMSMRVVGREYLAFGEMNMYYHDLKIRITRPDNKRTLLSGLTTFLANTLIKNENRSRTGKVFFVRWRDRSPINYLVKIALSGMTSSVGIKKNKKLIRKYNKEIKSRNLPKIEG